MSHSPSPMEESQLCSSAELFLCVSFWCHHPYISTVVFTSLPQDLSAPLPTAAFCSPFHTSFFSASNYVTEADVEFLFLLAPSPKPWVDRCLPPHSTMLPRSSNNALPAFWLNTCLCDSEYLQYFFFLFSDSLSSSYIISHLMAEVYFYLCLKYTYPWALKWCSFPSPEYPGKGCPLGSQFFIF